ncbi:MAG: IPT/TIG domain-containing protein, partial [Acidobacteria bacterium]|nr:IPT/TIG domain-containing protein [Acidobacteriota bacterium]
TMLSPSSADEFGPGFELTVTGSDFLNISKVRWNGSNQPTTFVSGTELHASISSGLIEIPGSAMVTVFNPAPGGGESVPVVFPINDIPDHPVPFLGSLDPISVPAGTPGFTLTANGSDFVPTAVVRWLGTPLSTVYQNASQLTAQVPASFLTAGQSSVIDVRNPGPGGGQSGALIFQVINPVPVLTSIAPTSAPVQVGGGELMLTLNGSNFVSNSLVQWNSQATSGVTLINSGQITSLIPANLLMSPGPVSVAVINPVPGGGTSAALTFTVTDFALSVDPGTRTVTAGSSASYTLTLTPQGGNFDSSVALSCSAGVPSRASCTFQPSSVTPGGSAATSTLTISTTAPSSAMSVPPGFRLAPIYAALLPLSVFVLLGELRRSKR